MTSPRGSRSLTIAIIVAATATARAHQSAVKYADLTVDGARVSVTLMIAPSDATGPLGLPDTAQPTVAEVLMPASTSIVSAYVATWFAIESAGAACPVADPAAAADADGRFVVVSWTVTCPAEITEIALDFTRLFAVDPRQEAIVTVHRPGLRGDPFLVRADSPRSRISVRSTPSTCNGRLVGSILLCGLVGGLVLAIRSRSRRRQRSFP